MIRHLLDTSVCIEMIRRPGGLAFRRLRDCRIGSVGISTITLAELEYGIVKSRDPDRNRLALGETCAPLVILSFDGRSAGVYGQVRTRLELAGIKIGALDTLIAAHALAENATLVTNNVREFSRVKGLRVEDWTRA